jgi:hypothetical protein
MRHGVAIADDLDRLRGPAQRDIAVENRQALAQPDITSARGQKEKEQQSEDRKAEPA